MQKDLDAIKKKAGGLGNDAKGVGKDTDGLLGLHNKDIDGKDLGDVDISSL